MRGELPSVRKANALWGKAAVWMGLLSPNNRWRKPIWLVTATFAAIVVVCLFYIGGCDDA
jgi:hypothetical protein